MHFISIAVQVCAYMFLAGVAAMSVDIPEPRMEQHALAGGGTLICLELAHFGLRLAGVTLPEDIIVRLAISAGMTTLLALFFGYAAYRGGTRQTVLIALIMGAGHVLMALFVRWAFSTG